MQTGAVVCSMKALVATWFALSRGARPLAVTAVWTQRAGCSRASGASALRERARHRNQICRAGGICMAVNGQAVCTDYTHD